MGWGVKRSMVGDRLECRFEVCPRIGRGAVRTNLLLALLLLLAGPSGAQSEVRADLPASAVDLHTHVFNAGYLPVEGIMVSRGVPKVVARLLARFLESRVEFADLSQSRDELFAADLLNPLELSEAQAKAELFNRGDLPDLTSRQRRQLRRYLLEASPEADQDLDRLSDEELVARGLEEAPLTADGGKNTFRFLLLLLRDEVTIVRTLRDEYPIGRFVHHMMDLEKAYDDRPILEFRDEQIPRMQALGEIFPDELVWFVAFDPFRRDQSLEIVKAAVRGGAAGIKFYPPSGYRAANNDIPKKPRWYQRAKRKQWKSRYRDLRDADLDRINDRLFAWAAERGVPILTHCTPAGFEASKGYGKMSDPDHWKPVLDKYPNLRIAFGHGGGGEGWFAEAPWDLARPATYGEKVYALVTQYENAYLGVGYWDEILDGDPAKDYRGHLQRRLERLIDRSGDPYRLGDKMLYGTDWHMVSKLDDRRRLLTEFLDLFDQPQLRPWRDRLFVGNVERFLNLTE